MRAGGLPSRTVMVAVALVVFSLWRPLLAGGTLAPDDQAWATEPFLSEAPVSLTIEANDPTARAEHTHWLAVTDAVRSGELTWWLPGGAGGRSVLAAGVPVTHLVYLVVPGWFAPGLIGALVVLLAITGLMQLARARGATPEAALVGGVVYGFSGLLWVWLGLPEATVLALAPWVWFAVLDTVVRPHPGSVVRLAAATALSWWCGAAVLTGVVVVGGVFLAFMSAPRVGRSAARVVIGVACGLLLAAPQLLAAASEWRWAAPSSVSADADPVAVLTAGFASLLGNESVGSPWFGGGTFRQSVLFVGALALVLAGLGWWRRSASSTVERVALPALALAGAAVTVGVPPLSWAGESILGDAFVPGHARVWFVLAVALGVADGAAEIAGDRRHLRLPAPRFLLTFGSVAAMVGGLLSVRWLDVSRDAGAVRSGIAASTMGLLVVLVGGVVLVIWRRGHLAGPGAVWALGGLVVLDLLSVVMAVPTVTDRAERLRAGDVHAEIAALAGDDGRTLGLDGTLGADTAARFGLNDITAPTPRSEGLLALFSAADDTSLRLGVGGSPESPRPHADTAASPIWRAFGVDVITLPADREPPGPRTDPPAALRFVDPSLQPATATLAIPPDGLRAVVVVLGRTAAVDVEVDVVVDGDLRRNRVTLGPTEGPEPTAIAVPGEDLVPGRDASVTLRVDAEPGIATLGMAEGVTAVVGHIGGDPRSELVRVDPLIVVARSTPTTRWATSVEVEPSAVLAADRVARRTDPAVVVLDRSPVSDALSAPSSPPVVATLDDEFRVRSVADAAGLLVFDVPRAPGWSATIDGDTAPTLLADAAFVAIEVPAGDHEIVLRYRPPQGRIGVLVSLLGSAFLVMLWVLGRAARPEHR